MGGPPKKVFGDPLFKCGQETLLSSTISIFYTHVILKHYLKPQVILHYSNNL